METVFGPDNVFTPSFVRELRRRIIENTPPNDENFRQTVAICVSREVKAKHVRYEKRGNIDGLPACMK